MSLEIKLEAFEGPLDLLLMLIEKNKVDIYDIPISVIADQYMEYVASIEGEDLDTLSDFLVMASTLLDIKARMLLPREEDENGEEIDPRTELVERLIEYQEYKMLSGELSEKLGEAENRIFRDPSIPKEILDFTPEPDLSELLKDVSTESIRAVFEMVMKRQEDKVDPVRSRFGNIKKDPVRISDKLVRVLDLGKQMKRFSFRELLEAQKSRADVVVTFLACLELIKVGQILAEQSENFGDIDFVWNEDCDSEISKEDIKQYD